MLSKYRLFPALLVVSNLIKTSLFEKLVSSTVSFLQWVMYSGTKSYDEVSKVRD